MKKIIAGLFLCASATGASAATSLLTTVAQEEINGSIKANLYGLTVTESFKNGFNVSGSLQRVVVVNRSTGNELRPELGVGYTLPLKRVAVYGQAVVGQRQRDNVPNADYYHLRAGARFPLSAGFFADVAYRYRDSSDIQWMSRQTSAAVGYRFSKSTAVMIGYGELDGDYRSKGIGVYIVNRF